MIHEFLKHPFHNPRDSCSKFNPNLPEVLAPLYCGMFGVQRRSLILKIAELPVRLKLFLEAAAKLRTFSGLFRESALRTYLFMGRAIGEGNFRQNAPRAVALLGCPVRPPDF